MQRSNCKYRRILNSSCWWRDEFKVLFVYSMMPICEHKIVIILGFSSFHSWSIKESDFIHKIYECSSIKDILKKGIEMSYRIQIYNLLQQCLPLLQSYYFIIQFCYTYTSQFTFSHFKSSQSYVKCNWTCWYWYRLTSIVCSASQNLLDHHPSNVNIEKIYFDARKWNYNGPSSITFWSFH